MIDYHEGLKPSQRLYDRVTQLYITVFAVLDHIIFWYRQRSGIRRLKAVLQQSSYERELEEKVQDFKDGVLVVKSEGTS
jgi:hypothetical protein